MHDELLRRPAAVIFDMDGLMLDTEPLAARAWGEAAAMLGVDFDMSLAQGMIGRNFADCSAMLRAHYAAPYPVDALLAHWHAAYDGDRRTRRSRAETRRPRIARLARGTTRFSAPWRHRPAATARAASSRKRRSCRASTQIVGGDEVAFGKPAPDIYIEAARRLGTSAAACLVLEDSEPGVRAALAAGMMPIMVPDLIPPSADLVALDLIVLPTLHDVSSRASSARSAVNSRDSRVR